MALPAGVLVQVALESAGVKPSGAGVWAVLALSWPGSERPQGSALGVPMTSRTWPSSHAKAPEPLASFLSHNSLIMAARGLTWGLVAVDGCTRVMFTCYRFPSKPPTWEPPGGQASRSGLQTKGVEVGK